jgi:tetratricopeptide (TPR) repeat protein
MRRILKHGLEMAERNEHHRWMLLFRLESAWLHLQACDFAGARLICVSALDQARQIAHPYTISLSLILLGLVDLGLKQVEAARSCFNEVAEIFNRERVLMDWILRILLHYGLSHYWLSQNQPVRAKEEAERLCEIARKPGERTYLALGYQALAEIAIQTQNWKEAEIEISRALAALDSAEAPLAEWRVCATAAQIAEHLRQHSKAAGYWRRSADVLNSLADSLDENDPLRESLPTDPAVQTIRRRVQTG